MKKRFIMLAAVCAAALCLGGCTPTNQPHTSGDYAALNEMLKTDYSQVVLTVTDTFEENVSLTSEYTIVYSESSVTVAYTVEKFSSLTLEGSANMKTVLTGEAVIENGAIVSTSGDDVGLSASIAQIGLDFQAEYFENAQLTEIFLMADVKDAEGFLGTEISCSDMRVEATFLDFFYDITISYTSAAGNAVEYRYNFTH